MNLPRVAQCEQDLRGCFLRAVQTLDLLQIGCSLVMKPQVEGANLGHTVREQLSSCGIDYSALEACLHLYRPSLASMHRLGQDLHPEVMHIAHSALEFTSIASSQRFDSIESLAISRYFSEVDLR